MEKCKIRRNTIYTNRRNSIAAEEVIARNSTNNVTTDKEKPHSPSEKWFKMIHLDGFKINSLFWLLIIAVSFVGLSIHLSSLITQYNSKSTTQIYYHQKLEFKWPVITLCPLAEIDFDKIISMYNPSNEKIDNFSTKLFEMSLVWKKIDSMLNISDNFHSLRVLNTLYFQYNERYGFTRHVDRIFYCYFNKEICSFLNFTLFSHPTKFNCFQFKIDENLKLSTGLSNGLTLMFELGFYQQNIGHKQYYESQFYGMTASFHENGTSPEFWINTVDVTKGHKVNFEIEANLYENMPSVNPCLDKSKWLEQHGDLFYIDIIQKELYNQCGCYSNLHYNFNNSLNITDSCLYLNFTLNQITSFSDQDIIQNFAKIKCYYDSIDSITNSIDRLHSPKSCSRLEYVIRTFSTKWPTNLNFLNVILEDGFKTKENFFKNLKMYEELKYMNYFMKECRNQLKSDNSAEKNQFAKDHFILLNIYIPYHKMGYFKEESLYSIENLLTDIAGSLGLWIGANALTIINIIHYLYRKFNKFKTKFNNSEK